MCGITGICTAESSSSLKHKIAIMNDALVHRGPDGSGEYVSDGIALGHRRLSIIDLSDLGAQPMVSSDQRFVMSYNGEVYNFKELRSILERRGSRFRGRSDSEVVLEAFAVWGKSAFSMFNGMYSLAIWDTWKKKLFLARDRFGIKPLYYCFNRNCLVFASEIKAILPVLQSKPPLSRQGFLEYLYYGVTHGNQTLYENICKLKSGHFIEWQPPLAKQMARDIVPTPFWTLRDVKKHSPSRVEAIEAVRAKLNTAVQRHLIADVPVGLFLSGGLDSTSICALAARSSQRRLRTWSVEFEGRTADSELTLARQVAERYGTEHHELKLSYQNLRSVIEQLSAAHDQPFGDAANIPLFLMTRELGSDTKVVLQGDGGDELFGGYKRYNLLKYRRLWQQLSPLVSVTSRMPKRLPLLQRFHRMLYALSAKSSIDCRARLLTEEVSDYEVNRLIRPEIAAELNVLNPFRRYDELSDLVDGEDAVQAMLWTDSQILLPDQFLEKVDRSTMANSIEVRVPMLDNELADYVMGLPARMKLYGGAKSLLREATMSYLPKAVAKGKKRGFGVPYAEWLSGPLSSFSRELILGNDGLLKDVFLQSELEQLIEDNEAGHGFRGFMLYKLLVLSVWAAENEITF